MNQKKICRDTYETILGKDNQELIEKIVALSSVRHVKKKQYIVRIGEEQKHLYFIYRGVLRTFIDKNDNQELTDSILYKPGTIVLTIDNIERGIASHMLIQALTDSILISIPLREWNRLLNEYPELKDIYIDFLIESLKMHMELKMVRSLNDINRCEWFLKTHRILVGKIQKQYIASYLDMTLSSYGKALKKIQATQE